MNKEIEKLIVDKVMLSLETEVVRIVQQYTSELAAIGKTFNHASGR